ncbi:hypothetical protein SAMN04487979_13213 [Flavobacterium sp. ov086]|nr:hypothetical protein SAMN04487979_13213 [Flavobacterium sp. ov086]
MLSVNEFEQKNPEKSKFFRILLFIVISTGQISINFMEDLKRLAYY